jgi:HSP20 family protein
MYALNLFDKHYTYYSDEIFVKDGVTTLQIDVPGLRKEDLDISFDRGILAVSGERKGNRPKNYLHKYRVREDVDVDSVEARLEDGVLTINLRRKEGSGPRKVLVS